MRTGSFQPDGYCGLYCKSCPVYMASESGEIKDWDIAPCHGCKSDTVSGWCSECNLKSCAREKGHEFCYECSEYPCTPLQNFKDDPQYPYHSEVFDYMKIIKIKGKEGWLKDMERRWGCPSCKTAFNWWTQSCTNCNAETNGYKQPTAKGGGTE